LHILSDIQIEHRKQYSVGCVQAQLIAESCFHAKKLRLVLTWELWLIPLSNKLFNRDVVVKYSYWRWSCWLNTEKNIGIIR